MLGSDTIVLIGTAILVLVTGAAFAATRKFGWTPMARLSLALPAGIFFAAFIGLILQAALVDS